jgi:glycosyltransferase involved in cell wall biosynthesis
LIFPGEPGVPREDRALKLIYDLRLLTGQMHGMARYALELLRVMLDAEPELGVGALVRKPEHARLLPADERVVAIAANLAPYGLGSQMNLPRILGGLKPDIYHCPFYAPPARYNGPMVFTIHDLIHLRFPKDHGLRHRLFYLWVVAPAAKRAGAVFTPSAHSKQDLIDLIGVPEGKIVITPNAAGRAFQPPAKGAAPPAGLPARYILGVGNPKPHKNLGALVQAHQQLRRNPPGGVEVPPLVVVGVGPGEADWAKPGDELILLPSLDDADLALAYGLARAVVVPSLYEGFGLPALEALACGAPVLAAERASLPEVVGSAGLLVEPDAESLAEGLRSLLADSALAQRLRQAGPKQAAKFSWARTAKTTLATYRRVAARWR